MKSKYKKNKQINNFLNEVQYEQALKYDQRNFFRIYYYLLKNNQNINILSSRGIKKDSLSFAGGILVEGEDGTWIYFDMVPDEIDVRSGEPEYTGRLCVIGAKLKEDALAELFHLA